MERFTDPRDVTIIILKAVKEGQVQLSMKVYNGSKVLSIILFYYSDAAGEV